METLEAILTRRSARRFKPKQVDTQSIDILLRAAMAAPSAHNEQPWHFIVVTKRDVLDKLATSHPYAKMCLEAPLAIVPCMDTKLDKGQGHLEQDMSAAIENLLIAVRSLGLGAVWCGVYPKQERIQEIANLFKLPKNIQPFAIIPIGYTDAAQIDVDRYQEQRVHHNAW